MPRFALHISEPADVAHSSDVDDFYWTQSASSTFVTRHGPNLGRLGPVPDLNIDAVRVAFAVYAADRSALRKYGGSNWNNRVIDVQVAVSDAAIWTAATGELQGLVGFLTGDTWTFSFVEETTAPEDVAMHDTAFNRVVLLSGGADSVIGALLTRSELAPDQHYALVSHSSQGVLSPVQRRVATAVEASLDGPTQEHVQLHLTRKSTRLDGSTFSSEPSSRSRSFLFLTLGLAVASVDGVPLWIPENGLASLNPPLGRDRLGSLSTRTTHPAFLGGIAALLNRVGAHSELHNPFASRTKGEMFTLAEDLIGQKAASRLLSLTNSCAHTGHPGPRSSSSLACGVCFGCVVRRASFLASGIKDRTQYADPSESAAMKRLLDNCTILPAVRSFLQRGVRATDLAAMSLPEDYSLDAAADLCARGMAELTGYCTP